MGEGGADATPRPTTWRPLLAGVAVYAAFLAAAYVMVRSDLTEMDPCFSVHEGDLCYCELFRTGLIKQPVNTASNLVFALVGFAVLADLALFRPAPRNALTRDPMWSVWYGMLALYLGPGSMVFHASYTWWAGILDGVSMYAWLSFVVVYDLERLLRIGRRVAFALWLAINAAWVAMRVLIPNQGSAVSSSTLIFVALLCLMLISIAAVVVLRREHVRFTAHGWLLASFGFFGVGLAVWLHSGTGQALCVADSVWQGHAAWHLSAAVAVGFLYLYLRQSEDAPSRAAPALRAGSRKA
ncbi:MAG: ceramidase domain-containing protein [Polyangiaceae bacterium]